MNYKLFLPLIFSILLLSGVSAMTVYADFSDSSQSATITAGDSISFNVDFFSMNPPMNSIKAGLYSGSTLVQSFLDSSISEKTYYHTYTYTASVAGTYKIKVIGTDNTNTDSEFLTLVVNPAPCPINHAPHITTSPSTQVNENTAYSYNVDATDEDGDTLTYSLTSAPSWLSINSVTGLILGTAPLVTADTPFSIAVKVTDGNGGIDTQTYTLTVKNVPCPPVNHAPVITTTPVTNVNENTAHSYNVDATDSDGDDLTYSLTSSLSWLSINSATGLISGTAPSVSADTPVSITVQVSDGTDTDTQTYTLTVKNVLCPVNHAPVITSHPVTSVVEGNTYNYHVTATDSDGDDLTYSLTEAPGWLTINPNSGLISGEAPSVSSNTDYQVEVEVSDGNGGIDTQSYTLRVKNYDSNGCSSCEDSRIISADPKDENEYLHQFQPKTVVPSDTSTTQKTSGISILTLIYVFILGIVLLGIIITFLLMFNQRKYLRQKSKFNETYY